MAFFLKIFLYSAVIVNTDHVSCEHKAAPSSNTKHVPEKQSIECIQRYFFKCYDFLITIFEINFQHTSSGSVCMHLQVLINNSAYPRKRRLLTVYKGSAGITAQER